jgi:thiol:disulfide interchange protein
LPAFSFMLSFTAMALGLAFPYLLLSMFPQLVEKLPRPGPWMESFKQGMSFLLFATAGYLLWIYAVQIKVDAVLSVVIGLTAIATAAWIYGRWCVIGKSKRARTVGTVMLLIFAAFGVKASMPGHKSMDWQEWSTEAVEEALEEGRPVYIDFTAAWCATCQQNKKLGYNEEVQKILKEGNVLLLKADKTNPVPEIDAAIRALGEEAIPVNVLYVPGEEAPHKTQTLFTSRYMINFLNEHLPESGAEETK